MAENNRKIEEAQRKLVSLESPTQIVVKDVNYDNPILFIPMVQSSVNQS